MVAVTNLHASSPPSRLDLDAIKQAHSLRQVAAREGVKLKRVGNEWKGLCPFHSESTPSFTIYADEKRWHCFGCQKTGDVLDFVQEARGLRALQDAAEYLCGSEPPKIEHFTCSTSAPPATAHNVHLAPGQSIVATFDYVDADGVLLHRKHRIEPGDEGRTKTFRFDRPGPNGSWIKGQGDERVPYRLPDLVSAPHSMPIFMAEGEAKADRLAEWGFLATSHKDWKSYDWSSYVRGRTVFILPDNDEAGQAQAEKAHKAIEAAEGVAHVIDLPGLPDGGDILDWDGGAEELRRLATKNDRAEARITATPFLWRDPTTIPQRPWIYGRHLLRGTVSLLIAPGATGKSALVAGRALSLATGRPFLGHSVWEGPKRVWIWNLEDSREELDRSIMGAAIHWGLGPADIADRLFVDTALDGAGLCLASAQEKTTIIRPVADALATELEQRAIDVLVVDPFISSHACDENDNPSIDAIVKEWGRIANRTATSILLVHHTRKQLTGTIDADSARGAKALVDGARMVEALNRMSTDEAEKFGVPNAEHRQYFSADAGAKPNRAPAPGKADWYHLASVSLGNGPGGGDSIGVAEPWSPPDAFDGVSVDHLRRVQAIIADGEYRENQQANNWAGHAVAEVLGLDLSKKADRRRAASLLREWRENGCFTIERRPDAKGDVRPFLVVGKPA